MDEAIRTRILAILDGQRLMSVATLRPDGWPQATTVGYVNDGLTLYFLCSPDSQKAANIARDNRVSLTINPDADQLMQITGLSMAAFARKVEDPDEADRVLRMMPAKYPAQRDLAVSMPTRDRISIFRVVPKLISVLDYSRGFGHTDLVTP